MAYVDPNFKTKKALKEALAEGKEVSVFQPGPFSDSIPQSGKVYLEGPHAPEPHRWYAEGWVENGRLVKIK